MHLWQHNVELTIATFVICGYTAGLWFHLSATAAQYVDLYRQLRKMPINAPHQRVRRLFTDFGFWWSLFFGLATIGSAGWYAGLRHMPSLIAVEALWGVTTLILNYETTILQPTTRCRNCSYQLLAQLDPDDPAQRVRCPECGKKWSKSDLCLLPPGVTVIRRDSDGSTVIAPKPASTDAQKSAA